MSLVEIVVALTILSTVLVALGGLMFQAAQHTRRSAAVAYRSAALTSSSAWVQGLPWDSIPGAAGCVTDSVGLLEYSRCVTVSNLSSTLRRITVAISPTGNLLVRPESVVIERNKPRKPSPLN
ncbi:MAG: hypothetical protein ACE5PT_13415 [Gemmatimonadales bacterium]